MQIDDSEPSLVQEWPLDQRSAEHGDDVGSKSLREFDDPYIVDMRHCDDEIRSFELRRTLAEKEFRFASPDVAVPVAQPPGAFAPKVRRLELLPDLRSRPLRAGLLHDRKRASCPAQPVGHVQVPRRTSAKYQRR